MELEINEQAIRLLLSLLVGLLMGLTYDLLRPVRRRLNKVGAALTDLVFAVLVFALAFVYAMGAGNGKAGQWELAGMLLGFLLYIHFASKIFLPVFELWIRLGERLVDKLRIVIK